MALAPLGFTVDTDPVARAVADLERLTGATAKAEAATKTVSAGTNAAAASTRQLGAATAAAAAQMTIATNAVRANNAALAITNQAGNAARQQMQNLSFQFQDIGTMLASGQSPFILLAQQLPQITQHGGRLTGVVGALGSTIRNLVSPLGLLTTGFVLAGSAAISYFADAGDEADKAAEALEEQRDLVTRVADEWGAALPQVKAYADELARANTMREGREAVGKIVAHEFDRANEALGRFIDLTRDVLDTPFRGVKDAAMELYQPMADLEQAAAALREEIARGGDTTDEFADLQRVVADVLDGVTSATGEQRDELVKLGQAYLTAGQNAITAAQAFNLAAASRAAAEANRGRFDKTGQRVGEVNPLNDMEFNSCFGWEDTFDFPKERKTRTRQRRKTEAERAAERYADLIRGSQEFIVAQELERQALGMTEEAAQALRIEQDLLNQAANDNIDLTPQMAAELKAYAATMAAAEAETARLQEAMDFANDLAKGFMSDLMGGLMDGQSLFESFADAAVNALQRIADKLLDMAMDQLIQSLFSNLMGAGLGGLGGGFPSAPASASSPTVGLWAKGGAFSGGNIIPFARGGIVSQPTLFPMANGAGLMGEAGPEVIAPIKRGPDGRMGVTMYGANQNGGGLKIENHIHNNAGVDVRQEEQQRGDGTVELHTYIDKKVSQLLSTQGTKSNRALRAMGGRAPLKNVGG